MKVIERFKLTWALYIVMGMFAGSILLLLLSIDSIVTFGFQLLLSQIITYLYLPIIALILVIGLAQTAHRIEQLLKGDKEFDAIALNPEQAFEKAVSEAVKAGMEPADIKRVVVQSLKNQS